MKLMLCHLTESWRGQAQDFDTTGLRFGRGEKSGQDERRRDAGGLASRLRPHGDAIETELLQGDPRSPFSTPPCDTGPSSSSSDRAA